MDFEWDEDKRQSVLAERQVDLVRAARIFEGPVLNRHDGRTDYGERRYQAVGMVGEDCFVVVYTMRDETVRLITAWNGGRRAKARYQASFARRNHTDG